MTYSVIFTFLKLNLTALDSKEVVKKDKEHVSSGIITFECVNIYVAVSAICILLDVDRSLIADNLSQFVDSPSNIMRRVSYILLLTF